MNEDLERYVKHLHTTLSPETIKTRIRLLKAYLKYCTVYDINYIEATREDVSSYLMSCCCSSNTRKSYTSFIKSFYSFLNVSPNPAESFRFKGNPIANKAIRSKEHICRIIEAVFYCSIRNGLMIELMYGSGLRCGEVSRLNTGDIDIEEKTVYVKGKGESNRYVPLSSTFLSRVKEYDRFVSGVRGPLFITQYGTRMQPANISKIVRLETGIAAHQYRRAGATHMLQAGCDIRYIQEYLGHKFLAITQRYTHIDKSDLERVVDRFHPRNAGGY